MLSVLLAGVAQVELHGSPLSFQTNALLAAAAKLDLSARAPNVAQLVAEDAIANKSASGGYRIGAVLPVRATIDDFSGTILEDGMLYRLQATSPGALGMGINFKTFALPTGATLHMYTPDGATVRGAYTNANHKHYGGFAITPVPGASLVLELFVPEGGKATIEVESVVHHYKNSAVKRPGEPTLVQGHPLEGPNCFGCSGSCNINVACPLGAGWTDQDEGVTRILTAGGGSLCTGSLINNVESDGRQLLLTANHCGDGNADGWILMFDFQTSTCEQSSALPPRKESCSEIRTRNLLIPRRRRLTIHSRCRT
jgi:hypothetical protein